MISSHALSPGEDNSINHEVVCPRPKVSVVIPCYNAERYIGDTLTALEGQTVTDVEIICVDDGSTDRTLGVIQSHASADSRIKVLHQENLGAGPARNVGLNKARGIWIAFLDADDIYRSDFLEKMVYSGERYDSDLVICDLDGIIDKSGVIKPHYRVPSEITNDSLQTRDYSERLFQLVVPQPSNKLFKLDYIREKGLQFQSLPNCNDLFFTCAALASSERIAIVRKPLVVYRISTGTSIQDDFAKQPSKQKCLCVYEALAALRNYCILNGLLSKEVSKSFEAFSVVHSIAATSRALGHDDLLGEVYDFYQNTLVNEWHVSKPDKADGLAFHLKYELMVRSSSAQFAWVYKYGGKSRNGGVMRKTHLGARALLVIARNRLIRQGGDGLE